MNHEAGLQALKDGDLKTAVPLLAEAVQEADYSSEALNDAYTQALYRAGDKTRLAYAAIEIGDALLEKNPALAMDYFQRAFLGDTLDAACLRYIGDIYEGWAVPKTAASSRNVKPIKKVAHVVGSLHPDHEPARHLGLLIESLRQQGVESQVFTTEWASSWFFNTNGVHAQTTGAIPETVIASTAGNFIERAERIAASIRAADIDAAFYHADFNEQITARVAAFRPARLQVNVAYGTGMDADLFDGFIHVKRQGSTASHHSTEPRIWVPAPSDIAERVRACPPDMRHAMGLGEAETVSATLCDLKQVSEPKYLYVVTGLLKVFPNHFHLFAGSGDVKAIRAAFHAEGVLPRVRFLGAVSDTASVMAVADVYLCPFKRSDEKPLLDAMGAGRPCIATRDSGDPGQDSADVLGIPEFVADSEMSYLQIAQGLLRDAEARKQASALIERRFNSEFSPALLGRKYIEFLSTVQSH
jgi:hypothetical protein